MIKDCNRFGFLSRDFLKIIAIISMTVDHAGLMLFPDIDIFRIIGRIAFPIFAYMISEGCRYTRSRIRYITVIGVIAVLYQLVYFFMMGSLYQGIFVTFLLSIALICLFDHARKFGVLLSVVVSLFGMICILFVTNVLPYVLYDTDFCIDYGFFGVLIPVLVYLAKDKIGKLIGLTVGLIALSLDCGGIQWFSLLAVPMLLLYNGQKGRFQLKWFFYIYYPLHLVVLYIIDIFA